jgi:hypothetical protein
MRTERWAAPEPVLAPSGGLMAYPPAGGRP